MIPLDAFLLLPIVTSSWEHDDFSFIFLAYLVDNLLLFLGHFTFPLSTSLILWQMSFSVLFCAKYLLLAPLDSFAFFSTPLCFNNGLHQWSPCFLASVWVWPVRKGYWGRSLRACDDWLAHELDPSNQKLPTLSSVLCTGVPLAFPVPRSCPKDIVVWY